VTTSFSNPLGYWDPQIFFEEYPTPKVQDTLLQSEEVAPDSQPSHIDTTAQMASPSIYAVVAEKKAILKKGVFLLYFE
jgi:hypothetical protein